MKLAFRIMQLIRYTWEAGLPFLRNAYGGLCLPQVYCAPVSPFAKELKVSFTDDVIFRKGKKGMFQLVVLLKSLQDVDTARRAIQGLEKLSGNYVLPHEATFIILTPEIKAIPGDIGNDVFRLATGEEFAVSGTICKGRPVPRYYDMYQISTDLHKKTFAIVRPDRFLYAACDTAEQLQDICRDIRPTLGLSS